MGPRNLGTWRGQRDLGTGEYSTISIACPFAGLKIKVNRLVSRSAHSLAHLDPPFMDNQIVCAGVSWASNTQNCYLKPKGYTIDGITPLNRDASGDLYMGCPSRELAIPMRPKGSSVSPSVLITIVADD